MSRTPQSVFDALDAAKVERQKQAAIDLAWHEWRRGGIGGSDIAALLGLSRYASPTSLYYDKLGLLERDEESQRQRIGKRMEHLLALEFHDETGLYVVGAQTWSAHPDHDWARCTVDGFVSASPQLSPVDTVDLEAVEGTVQMKTDGRFGWPDGIPHNIRAQCIWEMGVTCVQHCWLIVMFAGFRVEVWEIPWDADAEADWAFMLEAARRFWVDNVQARVAPPVDDHEATTAALTEVYRDPAGELEADDDLRAAVLEVQMAMADSAVAEAREKRVKNELRSLLGDKTDLVDGFKVVGKRDPKMVPVVIASWRPQVSRKVDLDQLRELAPDLVEKCTSPVESRVLRVPKAKETSE